MCLNLLTNVLAPASSKTTGSTRRRKSLPKMTHTIRTPRSARKQARERQHTTNNISLVSCMLHGATRSNVGWGFRQLDMRAKAGPQHKTYAELQKFNNSSSQLALHHQLQSTIPFPKAISQATHYSAPPSPEDSGHVSTVRQLNSKDLELEPRVHGKGTNTVRMIRWTTSKL